MFPAIISVLRCHSNITCAVLVAFAIGGCEASAPIPYSIHGTWDGASGNQTLHIELTQGGSTNVTGTGYIRRADGSLNLPLTLSGTLIDSVLSIACPPVTGCAGYPAHITGAFARHHSEVGSFLVTMSNPAFQGTLTRQ